MKQSKVEFYDAEFFRQIGTAAAKSAAVIVPVVLRQIKVETVVDFGCADGTWLAVWKQYGATRVLGIDGDYVDRNSLLIDKHKEFMSADLSKPINIGRMFDLVQSLEVAEHLPPSTSEVFVDNLVRHGRYILFSAAVPGQLGINHLNERPYDYWRDLFARRDYVFVDGIRPAISGNRSVEWWYRYNTFLIVKETELDALPQPVRDLRTIAGRPITDVSPVWYKAFRFVGRHLSVRMSTRIASWGLKRRTNRSPDRA